MHRGILLPSYTCNWLRPVLNSPRWSCVKTDIICNNGICPVLNSPAHPHNLATFEWSRNFECCSIKKNRDQTQFHKEMDRQPGRQGDSYKPPKLYL